jgi:triosephosphate isomerase
MARKKIVAGNWKMNKTFAEAVKLASEIVSRTSVDERVTKIIFPPFPYLSSVSGIVMDRPDFFSGAQNCHTHDSGAYTGEVSAQALRSCEAKYVLVGHSERRQYFNEQSELLKAKTDACFRNELIPVYCVGEVLNERKEERHFDVVAVQISEVIAHLNEDQLKKIVLAYEPVWAIGTGETATPQQAQEMHAFIRKVLTKLFSAGVAGEIPVLYGGSCNPGNAKELFSCPDVDGGLIGGASLKADDFTAIINSF